MTIKPIDTIYRGRRFRSRLEARWAVVFHHLQVPWQYEPEGFELPTGQLYLPDFRLNLPSGPLWCEVKPDNQDAPKIFQLIENMDNKTARGTVLHDIPDEDWLHDVGSTAPDHYYCCSAEGWDEPYRFCICRKCRTVGFEWNGRAERIGCCRDDSPQRTFNDPFILKAFAAGRMARFEHGETPG